MHLAKRGKPKAAKRSPAHCYSPFILSQHWESKLSFQLSTPIIAQDMQHWLQRFMYFLFKTWMGKCTQTPFFPHPFLPIRRAVCFFIWPYERLGKLFQQYSDKGSPRFLRDIAKGRRKKNPTKTPPPATKLLDSLFNNFWAEQQILSTNQPSLISPRTFLTRKYTVHGCRSTKHCTISVLHCQTKIKMPQIGAFCVSMYGCPGPPFLK